VMRILFSPWKIRRLRPGLNQRTLGSKGRHGTSRQLKPVDCTCFLLFDSGRLVTTLPAHCAVSVKLEHSRYVRMLQFLCYLRNCRVYLQTWKAAECNTWRTRTNGLPTVPETKGINSHSRWDNCLLYFVSAQNYRICSHCTRMGLTLAL
jgi:hypothetical protein